MLQPFIIAADPLPYVPPSIDLDEEKENITFLISPLSTLEEERMGFELFRHGIAPMTDDTFRAHFVQEVIKTYGDGADEICDLLEEMWQANDIHANAVAMWEAQEDQRRSDEANGVEGLKQEPQPKHPMPLIRRSEAVMVADKVQRESQTIRNLHVERNMYAVEQRRGIARILIQDWRGAETKCEREDGIVTLESYMKLAAEIGKTALDELESVALSGSFVSEKERGNSDSPPEKELQENSSPKPKGGSGTKSGSSTSGGKTTRKGRSKSSSTPTQGKGSGKTTAA